jgi:integrase
MRAAFSSGLGAHIADFINFKHTVGVAFRGGEGYLRSFDDYCARNGIDALTKSAVEGWVCEWEGKASAQHRNWVSALRGLGRYLCAGVDADAYVIPTGFGKKPLRPMPYLFSDAEVERFFEAAAVFKCKSPWRWEAKAFFGLMAACGLRTCEARRLKRDDVDLASGTLDVKWSKGPRSRRLYIDDEVSRMLDACDRQNGLTFPGRASFFVTGMGNQIPGSVPGSVFGQIWDSAGLDRPVGGRQPRPYDLRHRFAYANIERWTAEGKDVMAMLPYLMRFMGHNSLGSTLYYLHISPDFMAGYADKVTGAGRVIPEVGFDD